MSSYDSDPRPGSPPRSGERLLRWIVPETYADDLADDLADACQARSDEGWGKVRVSLWYWKQVLAPATLRLGWLIRTRSDRHAVGTRRSGVGGNQPNTRFVRERVTGGLESVSLDVRFALRTLRRRPAFTAAILLALGLGIGATTTVFSVMEATLMQELPYPEPDRLVSIWTERLNAREEWTTGGISPPDYAEMRDASVTMESLGLHYMASMSLRGRGTPMDLVVGEAVASLPEVLGISPMLGRWFLPGEVGEDRHNVVVLGESFWRRQFGADPDILGVEITLEDEPYTVIGVVPAHFRIRTDLSSGRQSLLRPRGNGERPLWVPLGHNYGAGEGLFSSRRAAHFEVVGRLRPGISVEQAQAEFSTLLRSHAPPERLRVLMAGREELEVAGLPAQLLVVALPSALLLLIACGNVATLLLGEGVNRRVEFATRVGIGAGTRRLARQLLTESVLLGVLGSGVGVAVAIVTIRVLVAFAPVASPIRAVEVNGTVLFFACTVGILAGLLFGLAPISSLGRASQGTIANQLGARATRRAQRTIGTVLTVEITLAVVVLVTGGLLTRTLANMFAVNLGFDEKNLVALSTAIDNDQPPRDRAVAYQQIIERMEAIPGVEKATGSWAMPFVRGLWSDVVEIEERLHGEGDDALRLAFDIVMPGYHESMRIPLLAGRHFTDSDGPGSPRVAVVSESIARRLWPDEAAVGRRMRFGRDTLWHTVIGVVGDVRYDGLDQGFSSPIYRAYMQNPPSLIRLTLSARTTMDPRDLIAQMEEAARSVEPGILIRDVQVLSTAISLSATDHRYATLLLDFFSGAAILLAAIGVFGVTARSVAQRLRELAIRMALGADLASVGRLALRGNLIAALAGLTCGLICAFWASHLVSSLLVGVERWDALTYGGTGGLVFLVCLVAGYLPVRQVLGSVHPAQVLKEE